LFPNHKFVLFDPAPFCIEESDRIEIVNKAFTDQIAEAIEREHQGNYLFISDIRTLDRGSMPEEEQEHSIQKDNSTQRRWVEILQPARSLLKFRCPYPNKVSETSTVFFEGTMLFCPWGYHSSSEIKIIPYQPYNYKCYNHQEYESQLFYHNDVTRIEKVFEQPVFGGNLNQSYDGSYESLVLFEYIMKFPLTGKGKTEAESISLLSQEIDQYVKADYTYKKGKAKETAEL
jgi:hypothetical protein